MVADVFTRRSHSRILIIAFAVLLIPGCSEPTPRDMVEITIGSDSSEKVNNAARIIDGLLRSGFPNTACGTEDDPSHGCNGDVSLRQLHVQPAVGDSSGRVYLKCHIHDMSDYRRLLDVCLDKIREQVRLLDDVESQ